MELGFGDHTDEITSLLRTAISVAAKKTAEEKARVEEMWKNFACAENPERRQIEKEIRHFMQGEEMDAAKAFLASCPKGAGINLQYMVNFEARGFVRHVLVDDGSMSPNGSSWEDRILTPDDVIQCVFRRDRDTGRYGLYVGTSPRDFLASLRSILKKMAMKYIPEEEGKVEPSNIRPQTL